MNCPECGNEHIGECPSLEDGDYAETWRESWDRYRNPMSDGEGY